MGALIWLLENWKTVVGVVLLATVFAFGRSTGASSVQNQWDSERAALLAEAQKKSERDAKKILELETTKNENLERIDGLLANNHALWLRVPKAPCPKPSDPGVGVPTTPGDGAFPVDTQAAIEGYSRAVDGLFAQCDKIVESCRVNAEYLKSLGTKGAQHGGIPSIE
jgi:hypothetical protein